MRLLRDISLNRPPTARWSGLVGHFQSGWSLLRRVIGRRALLWGLPIAAVLIGLVWMLARSGRDARAHVVPATLPSKATALPREPATQPQPRLARHVEPPATRPTVIVVQQPPSDLARLKARYAAAREACLRRLSVSAEYQSARAEVDELDSLVRTLREGTSPTELARVSQQWIQAKSRLASMITMALNADPEVQQTEMALRGLGIIRTGWQDLAGLNETRAVDSNSPAPQASAGGESDVPSLPAN